MNMIKSMTALLLTGSLWLTLSQQPATATAQDPQLAAVVINQAWQRYRSLAKAEQEQLVLTLSRHGEAPQQKQLMRWTRYQTGGEQVVLKFSSPQADAGLGLLLDRVDRSAQQIWLRMPSWVKARRVHGNRQQQYFAGTDLTFEDNAELSGEDTSAYQYRLLNESAQGWWIEALPQPGSASAYSKREIWVTRDYAISRIDYFNRQGLLAKTIQNKMLQQYPAGGWRPNQVLVENHLEQRQTLIEIRERRFDTSLASQIFSQEFLGE